jgi:hypothetical protein
MLMFTDCLSRPQSKTKHLRCQGAYPGKLILHGRLWLFALQCGDYVRLKEKGPGAKPGP